MLKNKNLTKKKMIIEQISRMTNVITLYLPLLPSSKGSRQLKVQRFGRTNWYKLFKSNQKRHTSNMTGDLKTYQGGL